MKPILKARWLDLVFSGSTPLDKDKATTGANWIYGQLGLAPPRILFLGSPFSSRIEILEIEKTYAYPEASTRSIKDLVIKLFNKFLSLDFADHSEFKNSILFNDLFLKIDNQLYEPIRRQVEISFCAKKGEVEPEIGVNLFKFLAHAEEAFINKSTRGDFFRIRDFLTSGFYEALFLTDFCIISEMPSSIRRDDNNRLHCADSDAVTFKDGYKLFFWHGTAVPRDWIVRKDLINWEVIHGEVNTERRRCLLEILGTEKYLKLTGGVTLVDADFDAQGNEMKLFISRKRDPFFWEKIQYLEVICPSTGRKYILYPPNQKSRNVWQAKASTFKNQPIQIRHGDVGLLNLNKKFSKPIVET
jgi:hypothetical protein